MSAVKKGWWEGFKNSLLAQMREHARMCLCQDQRLGISPLSTACSVNAGVVMLTVLIAAEKCDIFVYSIPRTSVMIPGLSQAHLTVSF
jgi:hypothetical protein